MNLLTSQAALDAFISRFNTSTYSMNSAHKPRKIAVPLKKCKIDFATTSVVKLPAEKLLPLVCSLPLPLTAVLPPQLALVDRAPFVTQGLVSISHHEGSSYSAVVETTEHKRLSAPRELGSYSAFVVDGMPASADCKVRNSPGSLARGMPVS